MRRDIGNELIVAIIAVGVLALALAFGIILSLSNNQSGDATATIIAQNTAVALQPTTDINVSSTPEATTEPATATVEPSATVQLASATPTTLPLTATNTLPPPSPTDIPLSATALPLPTELPSITPSDIPPTEVSAGVVTATTSGGIGGADETDVPTLPPSATNTPEPTAAPTDTATNTPEPSATNTPEPTYTPTVTNTFVPTFTPTETITNTAEPTATPTDTATNTLEPTATPTDTATNTPEPTATPTDTATNTPEPTAIPTDTPTNTPEPTATPTDTATNTPEPTATPTDTPTNTPEPTATPTDTPTNTPEPTATPTDTPTNTPEPTATPTQTPTDTPTVSGVLPTALILFPDQVDVTPAFEQTPIEPQPDCAIPPDWTVYIVQEGDSLFGIAQVTDSTVNDLVIANCLTDDDEVEAGERLFVPQAPSEPVPTSAPTNAVLPIQQLQVVGCENRGAQIITPEAAQTVSGIFDVYGSASIPNFTVYLIEVRPASERNYTVYSFATERVENGSLGTINTNFFDRGLHFIRLAVADTSGVPQTCVVPVIFR